MKIRSSKDLRIATEDARHHYPKEIVRLELYRLAAVFYASKRFRDLSDGSDYCPYQPLRDEFERSEIARILLLVGSSGRLICHDVKQSGLAGVLENNIVGMIQDDVRTKMTRKLNVLEVCSKILHAALIVPRVRYQGNYFRQYLRPEITLFSDETRKVGWKATVSVDKLVAAFSNITS